MSEKGWHVLQVSIALALGTAMCIVGAVTSNPALLAVGSGTVGAALGNATPANLLGRNGNTTK